MSLAWQPTFDLLVGIWLGGQSGIECDWLPRVLTGCRSCLADGPRRMMKMCKVEKKILSEGKNLRSALFTLGQFKFRHFRPVASETIHMNDAQL